MMIKLLVVVLLISNTCGNVVNECSCTDICKDNEKELLGQGTWRLLHAIVENVKRTEENEKLFKYFVTSLQYLYPCAECRVHLQDTTFTNMEMTPFWLCSFHNEVNLRLNKVLHNCTKYL